MGQSKVKSKGGTMKLLSLNTHSLLEEDWKQKLEYIAAKIHAEQYDVIAFQEVNQRITSEEIDICELVKLRYILSDKSTNVRADNFALLLILHLQEYGDCYHWTFAVSHIGYQVFEEGLALLSKNPILEAKSFMVSEETNRLRPQTRRQIGIRVDREGQTFSFYSVHFGWWKKEKERFSKQWDRFMDEIKEEKGTIYIMGDFNNPAEIVGEGYDYIMKDGIWRDTWCLDKEQETFLTMQGSIDGWKECQTGLRIDLIIKNKPLKSGRIGTVFDGKNGAIVSDHFGVETTED